MLDISVKIRFTHRVTENAKPPRRKQDKNSILSHVKSQAVKGLHEVIRASLSCFAALPPSARGLLFTAHDGCSDSSGHALIPGGRQREGAKKDALLSFKDSSQKLPVTFLTFPSEMNHVSYIAAKEAGKSPLFSEEACILLKVVRSLSKEGWLTPPRPLHCSRVS